MVKVRTELIFDRPSLNGVVYTKESIDKALNSPILQKNILEGKVFASLDRDCPDRQSMRIDKVTSKNGEAYAELEILDTNNGRMILKAIENGARLSYHPRYLGEDVLGIDVVAHPREAVTDGSIN